MVGQSASAWRCLTSVRSLGSVPDSSEHEGGDYENEEADAALNAARKAAKYASSLIPRHLHGRRFLVHVRATKAVSSYRCACRTGNHSAVTACPPAPRRDGSTPHDPGDDLSHT